MPQSFSITGTSPSDCLVSYLGTSLGCYPSEEMQSTPADWAISYLLYILFYNKFKLISELQKRYDLKNKKKTL